MKKNPMKLLMPVICAAMLLAAPVYATELTVPPEATTAAATDTAKETDAGTPSTDASGADESESNTAEAQTDAGNQAGVESLDIPSQPEETAGSAAPTQEEATTSAKPTIPDGGDSITVIETEPAMDADGNVTVTVNTAEDITLPLTVTLKGSNGAVSFTVNRSGQQVKIKPDEYKVTKVVNGKNKKLPSGAWLTIPEEGGVVYLDFTKPETGENILVGFIKTNLFFIPFALLLCLGYLWYKKNIAS